MHILNITLMTGLGTFLLASCASTGIVAEDTGANAAPLSAAEMKVEKPKLSAEDFAAALETVEGQVSGDAIVRAKTSAACQRLYDNYKLMAEYAPKAAAPQAAPTPEGTDAPKKKINYMGLAQGALGIASGVAGIAGVAGGTDALLKATQTSSAMDGISTILSLAQGQIPGMPAKAAPAPVDAGKRTINVDHIAFTKGFALNCPVEPLKKILEGE